MTASVIPSPDEGYLPGARQAVVAALDGLSDYDIRRPLTPTGTNLLGLVKHLIGIEFGYLGVSVGRPAPVPLPWIDAATMWRNQDMWATPGESREYLLGLYRTAWSHSDTSLRELGGSARATVPWWPNGRKHTALGSLACAGVVRYRPPCRTGRYSPRIDRWASRTRQGLPRR